MNKYLLLNANIINEGNIYKGSVEIKGEFISNILTETINPEHYLKRGFTVIDLNGKYLMPGGIDDQVHFREPGATNKGEIYTESKAAVAGGITSYMDMPNNNPPATTQELLEDKYKTAAEKSLANYSFFLGATNDNINEIIKTTPENVCGIKVFLGSSTGNMLVDNPETLRKIFSTGYFIAVHCENEEIIKKNTEFYRQKFGEDLPFEYHSKIRSAEACFKSTEFAVDLAKKHNTRLHILHLSTAEEIKLLNNNVKLEDKNISSEVCVHYLLFDDSDYKEYEGKIKCNPSIKTKHDKDALLKALLEDKIDIIATDHAPHTFEEKDNKYFSCPSGIPLIQHSLTAMLELFHDNKISLEKIVDKMCHSPAICYKIDKRGFIKKGFYADLTVVDLNNQWMVNRSNILYKCKWSPFEGTNFRSKILHTFVNGNHVYYNGVFNESKKGKRINFNRL